MKKAKSPQFDIPLQNFGLKYDEEHPSTILIITKSNFILGGLGLQLTPIKL